jgi:hypothetical protein
MSTKKVKLDPITKSVQKAGIEAAILAAEKVGKMRAEFLQEFLPSAILYKKMPGDMILITGFRGILTADEIEKKYGSQIASVYGANEFRVYGSYSCSGGFGVCLSPGAHVYPGHVFQKKDFAKLVVSLKNAGKLLAGIVAACKNAEVKEVEL